MRWDSVFELAAKEPKFLLLFSNSSIIMIDKQDPSLAGELASHYQLELFLDNTLPWVSTLEGLFLEGRDSHE